MNSDSCFIQGAGHTVCQDYSVAVHSDELAIAVVCDGCSDSIHSEVGAAILANIFVQAYGESWNINKVDKLSDEVFQTLLKAKVRDKILEICRIAGLAKDSTFDSTLVAVVIDKYRNKLSSYLWGDGSIIVNNGEEGQMRYEAFFPSSAPYYFAYSLDPAREQSYLRRFSQNGYVQHFEDIKGDCDETSIPYSLGYVVEQEIPEGLQWAAVFSDGVGTFTELKEGQSVPIDSSEITAKLTAFKNPAGDFVKRRMRRFKKECEAAGISHFDDISCAAIHI